MKKKPAFDKHGYPTEETLNTIANWPPKDGYGTGRNAGVWKALLEYVREVWRYETDDPERIETEDGIVWRYKFATGGWSGNEDIIHALERNRLFQYMCWESSHRGGLEVYHVEERDEQ